MTLRTCLAAACLVLAVSSAPSFAQQPPAPTSQGLVASGRLPASLRDKFGETFGSGSGMAMIPGAWRRTATGYEGEAWLLPDRGYNVEGTTDYRARINRVGFAFDPPAAGAVVGRLELKLLDTVLLTDETGQSMSGLDPVSVRPAKDGFPDLPMTAAGRVSLDPEAVVLLGDGSFLISDEYGPAIYHFSKEGRMISATLPPQALRPMRQQKLNFSSNNPGPGGPVPTPKDPETGRQNNQGFEGMALSPDGKLLTVILQSAARQDGGDNPATRRHTRALTYDAANVDQLKLVGEAVVPLPTFIDDGKPKVAAQSEAVWIAPGRFLLLSRDSGNGYGVKGNTSLYRRIDVLDLNGATNIAGSDYDGLKPVAPKGVLAEGVVPATLSPFIDINDNAQLGRVGLHNGEPNDRTNLSEKWEAMGLAPALDDARPEDWFLFVANDNDFITQDGFQVGAPYKDASGADVDTVVLVYRVTIPGRRP